MARRALQRNNGSPVGYGQPDKRSPEAIDRFGEQQDFGDSVVMDEGAREMRQYQSQPDRVDYGQQQEGPKQGVQGITPELMEFYRQQLGHGARPAVQDRNGNSPWHNYSQPQDQAQPQQGGLARGDASRGALAQYGTGNIQGATGLRTGDYMGQLEGFNTGAWGTGERGSDSIKNSFGKIASRYDVTQPGATQRLMQDPEFQQLFPMAQLVQHPNGDLIDFGDGNGPVDVIRAAQAGGSGAAWQWGAQGPGQPQVGGPAVDIYNQPFMQQQFGSPEGQGELAQAGLDPLATQQLLQWLLQSQQQSLPQGQGDLEYLF